MRSLRLKIIQAEMFQIIAGMLQDCNCTKSTVAFSCDSGSSAIEVAASVDLKFVSVRETSIYVSADLVVLIPALIHLL